MSKEKLAPCAHEERKTVITAKTVEIHCTAKECKEVVHTRKRVLSSNIYAVGRIGKNTEVQFMNSDKGPGKCFIYFAVPRSLHNEMLKSKSIGKFFNANIKNDFDWKEVV